jgi:hypothetical protein
MPLPHQRQRPNDRVEDNVLLMWFQTSTWLPDKGGETPPFQGERKIRELSCYKKVPHGQAALPDAPPASSVYLSPKGEPMPKISYAQEVAALEETLAALQARADVVPPLALAVGEELAAQIAEIKRLKERQRFYAAEGRAATAAVQAATARGMVAARDIRGCAVLLYGPKDARLVRFGIRIRRRPRHKVESPAEVMAEAPGAARDAGSTARPGRASAAEIEGNLQEVGAEVRDIGREAGRIGGSGPEIGGKAPDVGAPVRPVGAVPACVGAAASGGGGNVPEARGNAQGVGANLPEDPRAAIRAA